ncbi:MAG: ornithine carbamoyltransferase [Gammaproteobacteria bacterium]|nr:ornithine carbamoyltransferase [Gammaproteobacteria bacterium]MBT8150316.1 ornithine carbamoyltransferase [Gammaproteobacteria bacterium]NND38520.1 ornithine carbamoyltransferase [Pseudomonadales bacterium]NNL10327.1 ornithine carbamoyltransferase [Pseudomonadales bacterium]NNM11123.1 ornithine carbamoyltransferase [Pseudomonadales bacterium]
MTTKATRHFLSLLDCSADELAAIIARALELKASPVNDNFRGKVLGMVFDKSSTRTRISFEAGMAQMGGNAIFLSSRDTQLGRGEPIEDSARVMSSMLDIIMVRTFAHASIEQFARYSSVPVINALTDAYHPCQLLADMMTFAEKRGSISGKTVAYVGDGNNMCQSYINAARQFNFQLQLACPEGFRPADKLVSNNADRVVLCSGPREAAQGADLVVTDTWTSMGQEEEKEKRLQAFSGYEVNHELMSNAANDAIFMHCLPAYRGLEVSADLLEDESISVVWDEAENRLHAQKALMEFLLS